MQSSKKKIEQVAQISILQRSGPIIAQSVANGEKISNEKRPTGLGRVG